MQIKYQREEAEAIFADYVRGTFPHLRGADITVSFPSPYSSNTAVTVDVDLRVTQEVPAADTMKEAA